MRTVLPFEDLVETSGVVLNRLGFKFRQNQTSTVLEFEVYEPAGFLVRFEDLNDGKLRPTPIMGFGGDRNTGTNVSIIVNSDQSEGKACISAFGREFLKALSHKPWEGLGFIEKRASKAYWHTIIQQTEPEGR